jgi:hypothetical protein
MRQDTRHPTRLRTLIAAALAAAIAAMSALAPAAPASASAPSAPSAQAPAAATACGAGAGAMLANTAGAVAQRIYAGEISGSETLADKRQIEQDGPLRAAVANGDGAAIRAAVTTLVYSHTHIVRLRVSSGANVLADIGGPYILAPVSGTLRSHGRAIARFVFSVQDDLGYVKLVTRFIGAPLILRTDSGQVPVEGQLSPGPPSIPDHGQVQYRNAGYEAYSFNASAYPRGRLRVSLLLPLAAATAAKSCAEIKSAELARVAQRISRRFTPLAPSNFSTYVKLARTLTHGLVYMRSGSRELGGSGSGPSHVPSSGRLRYHGVDYEVSSFAAGTSAGQVRVYVLAPPKG